jgi:pseudaminic acid cytidylyltransferase
MKLAIIPARGGSKRIRRKNIRNFAGKPIIAWSIEAAQKSGCFDRIIVSTDDSDIGHIARTFGAETPFARPAELSDDHTTTVPVVAHAIEWALQNGIPVTEACCIYATAPFIMASDIRSCWEILSRQNSDYVFPVTSYAYPIQRALKINKDGRIEMTSPELTDTRSQDLVAAYHDAGQFYWGRTDSWINRVPILSASAIPHVLPRYRVQDIDTEEDWRYAEIIFDLLGRLELERNGP